MWNTKIHFALIRVDEEEKGQLELWAQIAEVTRLKKSWADWVV